VAIVYIGIGSNLGNREENCLKAIRLLSGRGIAVRKQSAMYETEPWGVKDQPMFINMTIEIETDRPPLELLRSLKAVEEEIGRTETVRWGPRVIDMDILFYDDLIVNEPGLQIPHSHMHERGFVLKPLAEIAPDKVHPVLRKTVKELLSET
jgi:dihydroneopterin aldolase/2-amino-4-hydroxy-6-hydroxymethyldihydropteridine diphosphokinase